LTVQTNPDYLHHALSDGADGYILKSSTREEIVDAVRSILAGHTCVSHGIVGDDFDFCKWRSSQPRTGSVLTSLEREILQMLAEGHTAKEVASFLKLSCKTIAISQEQSETQAGREENHRSLRRAI
jgi:DNA-binding NarL/FixJ family response regulator